MNRGEEFWQFLVTPLTDISQTIFWRSLIFCLSNIFFVIAVGRLIFFRIQSEIAFSRAFSFRLNKQILFLFSLHTKSIHTVKNWSFIEIKWHQAYSVPHIWRRYFNIYQSRCVVECLCSCSRNHDPRILWLSFAYDFGHTNINCQNFHLICFLFSSMFSFYAMQQRHWYSRDTDFDYEK